MRNISLKNYTTTVGGRRLFIVHGWYLLVSAILVHVLFLSISRAAMITAGSAYPDEMPCSYNNVKTALDQAVTGDTVIVPAGTCTWDQTMKIGSNDWDGRKHVYLGKSITLQGSGIDKTIILDNVPEDNTRAILIQVYTDETDDVSRIVGFTFGTAPGNTTRSFGGKIALTGFSKSIRIDHNKFTFTTNDRAIYTTGWLYGVIDHNIFEQKGQAATIHHPEFAQKDTPGQLWGDGSWASPLSLGKEEAIFLEDNIFRSGSVIDGWMGGRHVVRHNTIESGVSGAPIANHGTESGGRYRGVFSWEIYENTYDSTLQPMFHMRGGTGVIFNNTITGPTWLTTIGNLNNYRNKDPFGPWGTCDGSSPWDVNDPAIYLSGVYSGDPGTDGTLLIPSAIWTENQWVGYSLRNVTKNWGTTIASNDANSISIHASVYQNPRPWDPGDEYQIRKVDICLDQIGRSTGDLITNHGTNPEPIAWPNQKKEPVHIWGNIYNGMPYNRTTSNGYPISRGDDYIEDIPRPNYKPFVYPHPLVSGIPYIPLSDSENAFGDIQFSTFKNILNLHEEQSMQIKYTVTEDMSVALEIRNQLGNLIQNYSGHGMADQENEFVWDGRNQSGNIAASGMYTLVLKASKSKQIKKVVLIK